MAVLPHAQFIDISHDVRLNNITEAAFMADQIELAPEHQHIIVVQVGHTPVSVVYQNDHVLYILPNNGIIGMLGFQIQGEHAYLCRKEDEHKAAALYLNNGISQLSKAGDKMEIRYSRQANINGDIATVFCIHSDQHGNCYFNIKREQFEQFVNDRKFSIRIQYIPGVEFKNLTESIRNSQQGEAILKFSQSGYLKLQINQGNARQLFRIKDDTKIIIELQ